MIILSLIAASWSLTRFWSGKWSTRPWKIREPEYRDPLLLQVIGGFSGDEIAKMLDLNNNTVMTRLFRARNKLKEKLESNETD